MSHPPATPSRIKAVAIMGATGTGKSNLAIRLAEQLDGEVISMDSRQVYRGLDIGTGKVSAADRERVPHHLLDILDVNETGSAGRHAEAAQATIRDIAARGRLPILAGGTGMYFRALFGGLVPVVIPQAELTRIRETFAGRETAVLHAELARVDPERSAALSPNDRVRITRALELIAYTGKPASELYTRPRTGAASDITYLKLVLTMPREALRARIEERTHELFSRGWITEVWRLLDRGVTPDMPGMQSLGYATIAAAIAGGLDPRRWEKQVVTLTQQYAKRQETYFRREKDAVWLDVSEDDTDAHAVALVRAFLRADAPQ